MKKINANSRVEKHKVLPLPKLKNRRRFKYIDATPDENYPLRILGAYLLDAQTEWEIKGDNVPGNQKYLYTQMNKCQARRAEILAGAIEKLSK